MAKRKTFIDQKVTVHTYKGYRVIKARKTKTVDEKQTITYGYFIQNVKSRDIVDSNLSFTSAYGINKKSTNALIKYVDDLAN